MTGNSMKTSLSGVDELCLFPPEIPKKLPKKEWIKTFQDTLSLLIYTERFVNKGAYHSYRHFSDVAKKYRPLDGASSFQLPFFLLPRNGVEANFSRPKSSLNKWFDNFPNEIPFFVHPDMLKTYTDLGTKRLSRNKIAGWVIAVPTASTRTMLVDLCGELQMVKVDMSGKRLGRLTRRLSKKSVRRSQIIHEILQTIPERELPETFGYFPESVGVTYEDIAGELGNIYREYQIYPSVNKKRWLIPFFSLYSQDFRNPGNELVIEQLIRFSGLDPITFFETKVVRPYIYNAFYMAFRYGLLFEPHPQNVLVELDEDFNITRFVYRDLQTVIVDAKLRRELGFKNVFPPETKIIASWQEGLNKQLEYSSFYDHRMAYQTLEEVILAIAAKYPAHIAELERIVKKVFWEVIKELGIEANKYFPKDTYYLYRDGIMKNNVMEPVPFNNPPYR